MEIDLFSTNYLFRTNTIPKQPIVIKISIIVIPVHVVLVSVFFLLIASGGLFVYVITDEFVILVSARNRKPAAKHCHQLHSSQLVSNKTPRSSHETIVSHVLTKGTCGLGK